MSYDYERQKKTYLFTDEGQRDFIKLRDNVHTLIKESGVFMAQNAWKCLGTYNAWDAMACTDRLVEIGEIEEVERKCLSQEKIYIKAKK